LPFNKFNTLNKTRIWQITDEKFEKKTSHKYCENEVSNFMTQFQTDGELTQQYFFGFYFILGD